MPQVSVIVLTYNPDNRKLRQTLRTVAAQKDVDLEILISDDGSKEKDFSFVADYMKSLGVENYRVLEHKENQGTVGSCISAVREATGAYVFLTSPGDYLYDAYVLRDFLRFSQEHNCQLCFGNAVFYRAQGETPVLTKTVGTPAHPNFYSPNSSEQTAKLSFFGGNWVIGASYFRKRELFLTCLEQILGESKYTEDSPSTAFAMAAGHRLCYFDRNVVWYEDGTGVSTDANAKWKNLLREDARRCFTKLKSLYPKDPYVDIAYRNLSVSNRMRRIVGKLLRHPILMLRLATYRKAAPKPIESSPSDLERLTQLLKTK